MSNDLAIFEGCQILRHYDEKTETWWFSVVDIIRVLTQQPDFTTVRKYWNKLKERLGKEGSQLVTDCHRLKMEVEDGKSNQTRYHKLDAIIAVDARIKAPDDKPTIGLLFCKIKKRLVAEYALSGIEKPMGIAEYQLVRALPTPLDTNLPSIEEIEAELSRVPETPENEGAPTPPEGVDK